jgi:hypothetical protein
MIRIGKYTFATEQDRAADYRARVGPLRRPRTNTVERPDDMGVKAWLDWLRDEHLKRWSASVERF